MLPHNEKYMQRCLQLAKLGAGNVAPNPMVGAVLVYENKIIGEGYHKQFGQAHAEVNCINSVKNEDRNLIEKSVLYVSLEPCAHYGKTPPCSDLIIQNKIKKVVIGCSDPFKEVNGKGIEKLKAAGVEVITGILEKDCVELNKRFFTFYTKQRPYIILKWAQTADNKIALNNGKQLKISNELTNKMVHKWRFEEAGILVGTNTIVADDPLLTNRLWTGKNPVRLIIDKNLKLPETSKIFNDEAPTIVFNFLNHTIKANAHLNNEVYYYQLKNEQNLIKQIINACYTLNIQSILVEGGAKLLQSFIEEDLFDEIRIITNTAMRIGKGLEPPNFSNMRLDSEFSIENDLIQFYRR